MDIRKNEIENTESLIGEASLHLAHLEQSNPETYNKFISIFSFFTKYAYENDAAISWSIVSDNSNHLDVSIEDITIDFSLGTLKEFVEILDYIDRLSVVQGEEDTAILTVSVDI